MSSKRKLEAEHLTAFAKTPSGIRGLDEITFRRVCQRVAQP